MFSVVKKSCVVVLGGLLGVQCFFLPVVSAKQKEDQYFGISGKVKELISAEHPGGTIQNVQVHNIQTKKDLDLKNYHWTVWHKEEKSKRIDTKEDTGNYHGFSKEKVDAWSEYKKDIETINDNTFPKSQEYHYPTTSATQELDFWADKPGYYTLHGDPLFQQVTCSAYAIVSWEEHWEEVVYLNTTDGKNNTDSGKQGFLYAEALSAINAITCNDAQTIAVARSLVSSYSGNKKSKNYLTSLLESTISSAQKTSCSSPAKTAKPKKDSSADDAKKELIETNNRIMKWHDRYRATEADQYQPHSNMDYMALAEMTSNSSARTGKKRKTEEVVLEHTRKEYSAQLKPFRLSRKERHSNQKVLIAKASIQNIYGGQLERFGILTVGNSDSSIILEKDTFWKEEPSYFIQKGESLSLQHDKKLPFRFRQKASGEYIGGSLSFTKLSLLKKDLVHGYHEIPPEYATNGKPPHIPAGLDLNNQGSQYAGYVPLVNFKIKGMDEAQQKKAGMRQFHHLTKEKNEHTLLEEE